MTRREPAALRASLARLADLHSGLARGRRDPPHAATYALRAGQVSGNFRIFVGSLSQRSLQPSSGGERGGGAPTRACRVVILPHDGGTTKADCLNHVWARDDCSAEAIGRAARFKAVVLHDAEDVVHADEIRLFDVDDRPLRHGAAASPAADRATHSRWIAGHYADEFAEAHGKHLINARGDRRGGAVRRRGLRVRARHDRRDRSRSAAGAPFDAASLTEDYEIGLRIAETQRPHRIRLDARRVRRSSSARSEHFPDTLHAAVRQKARWLTGISLAGWDRLGWSGLVARALDAPP
jgi:adsorption protein B